MSFEISWIEEGAGNTEERYSFAFDVTLSIAGGGSAVVTQRAVERGLDSADHKRPALRTIRASGIVTNTPTEENPPALGLGPADEFFKGSINADGILEFPSEYSRTQAALSTLNVLRSKRQSCSVETRDEYLDGFEVIDFEYTLSEAMDALQIEVVLQEVRTASTSVIAVAPRPAEPRASARRNRGNQETAAATPAEQQQAESVAYQLRENGIGALLP